MDFLLEDYYCYRFTFNLLGFGINVIVGDLVAFDFDANKDLLCGMLIQYPTTDGRILDYKPYVDKAHGIGAQVSFAVFFSHLNV
jgi:hypothetical protein